MKNILARGGIEFLAVLLGITLSLYIDQQIEESAILKTEKSLLSDLQVSLNQDIDYAHEVLKDMRGSIDAQEILINYECNEVENLKPKELGVLFGTVIRGSTSLFPRYGVYRSLVSNSEMKYIENQELKDKLIDLYDFKFKRYENVDPIITNLYQYGLGEFLVEKVYFDFREDDYNILISTDKGVFSYLNQKIAYNDYGKIEFNSYPNVLAFTLLENELVISSYDVNYGTLNDYYCKTNRRKQFDLLFHQI